MKATDALDCDLQPYAAAYLAAHPERVFAGHQYIVWISGQWAEWAAGAGVELLRRRTEAEQQAFGAWLADRWGLAS